MAATDTGIYIAVPEDIAQKVLCEGYQCSRRRRIPAHRNRDGAVRAYRRHQRSRPPVLLQAQLPPGVAATKHKDGIKLETLHLPARYLGAVDRSHSSSAYSFSPIYEPPLRATSHRPSTAVPSFRGTSYDERKQRLQRRENVQRLYHCTSQSNAHSILRQGSFFPGSHGFLGPGIYFSRTPANARRYCQCRTGHGPRVVIECQVNLGNSMRVPKGHYTGMDLLREGCDSYDEVGRDCYMLPDNSDHQIEMHSARIIQG